MRPGSWRRALRLGLASVPVAAALLAGCGSRSGLEAGLPASRGLGAASLPAGCVDIRRSYASVPPAVLLLIDRSTSMGFTFGDDSRWNVLRDAIVDPERGLLAALDQRARRPDAVYG